MRKNIFAALFLVITALFLFEARLAYADDASDMMDAALAQHQEAAVKEEPATTPPPAPAAVPAPEPAPVAATPEASVPAPAVEAPAAPEPVPAAVEQPVETSDDASSKGVENPVQDTTAIPEGLTSAAESGKLMIADFNTGDRPNNLGGDFGAWDKDPNDDTQSCRATFASDDAHGDMEGFALRLDYDVDSPSPAYNGFWMKLENLNATPYDTLSFYIRGASQRYTKRIKVEFKTPDNRSSSYYVSGIKAEWAKIEIPLTQFKGIKNWATLSEFILVFDDTNSAPKKGTLLVDEIMLERVKKGMPQKESAPVKAEPAPAPEQPVS